MDQARTERHERDYHLVQKVREGDRNAFQDVVRGHQQKVFQLAYAFFGNREDALDIVQETFMRMYQKTRTFKSGHQLQSWLLQIAKNLCIDEYRRHTRKKKEMETTKPLEDLNLAAEGEPDAGCRFEFHEVFNRCLQKLGERQRAVFILRHINELRIEEVANVLGIAPGTVKSLHFKAVQNLKGLMQPYMGEG